jgi:phosphatidylcholine synthase
MEENSDQLSEGPTRLESLRGNGVHLYTASGIIFAFLAMSEITSADCDPRFVFFWLLVAVLIDATDGPLARRVDVYRTAPHIGGRTIDDLLDFLTFVFIPLMLLEKMKWMPIGWEWTIPLAMGASLLGFAHVNAKYDEEGYFRGFPSYWNIFVFYAGWISTAYSPWITAVFLWAFSILTVSSIKLLYPNRAPEPWRKPILLGAILWTLAILVALVDYPRPPQWLMLASLAYPVFYFWASFKSVRYKGV